MAAAVVGGAFLSATLQVLFDRLASREFLNFFRAQKLDDKLLRMLKSTLRGLNVLLDDAEDKQITNTAVKDWVDELKVAVYHADDLLDEITTEALRCKSEAKYHSGSEQVPSPTLISSSSSFDADIVSKIEEIIASLEYFAKEKDVLGLREVAGQKWCHRLPTTSLVDESGVCGRDNDKEDVIKLLLSDEASSGNQKIDVIAIVGMGGVGKTTLAQFLYNDGRVDDHFDMKAWVCVSEEFDVVRVTRTILEAVIPKRSDTTDLSKKDLNQLQVKLKESLSGKKFLIVLDDVWNENYDSWDSLRSPFGCGGHGSRVIVTTRNESVSSIMQTVPIHRLQQLSDEDCWKLFAKHAFEKGYCGAHPNLERIGKEIVKKCKGLPLAAKTLAGLLRSKRDVEDWNNILKSGIWDLPKEKSNILPALKLSYHYLPSHLKRCFAYCSIFPKDYEFQMEILVLMWMAEGFVEQPRSNKTREEVGYECFYELQSRSFFQRSNAKKDCFVMHDLVNDLAQAVSGDFCYLLGNNTHHMSEREMPMQMSQLKGLQHLTKFVVGKSKGLGIEELKEFCHLQGPLFISGLQNVTNGMGAMEAKLEEKMHLTYLMLEWSSSTNDSQNERDVLDKLKPHTNLNMLEIKNFGGTRFPDWLGDKSYYLGLFVIHKRESYSSVVDSEEFEPEAVVESRVAHQKDNSVVKMGLEEAHKGWGILDFSEMLEWVDWYILESGEFSKLKELEVIKCPKLIGGLPKHIPSSVRLEIQECSRLMAQLSNICGAGTIELVLEGCDGVELGCRGLSSLTKLEISDMPNLKELTPELCTLTNLKEFRVWNCPSLLSFPDTGLPPMLTSLSIWKCEVLVFPGSEDMENCYRSLETLSLSCCDALKPMWLGFFPKLRSLQIHLCTNFSSLTDLDMLGLQNLTCLESLILNGFSNLKSLPEGMHTLFPSLQSLQLMGCPEIESFPGGGLPSSLHSLEIEDCSKLTARRREWDLQRLPSLRRFRLAGEHVRNWGQSFPEDGVESFPEEGLLPSTLMSLCIENLPNLKSLNNRGLQLLGSLKYMKIVRCPQIQSLVEEGLPNSLFMLEFFGCPMLKPRYLKGEGQDWHKIACVPVIHVDGEVIFEQLTLRPAMDSQPYTDTLIDAAIGDHVATGDRSGMSKMLMIFYHDVEVNVVQLGFLPRNVAKWVAPLSDSGLEGSSNIVQRILYVSQGPAFSDISKVVQSEHVSSICSLVASIQRSTGLWRLQEGFKLLQMARIFWKLILFSVSSFSIGSVTAQNLAAFLAASGKTSIQFSKSEESDPDKTWQRLRNVGMLHDAIPYPNDRVNHPVHVKWFSGYVYPKEVLVTALEGSISIEPSFSDISKVVQSEHISSICSLVASPLATSRGRYNWPEYLETDFVFSKLVTTQFLAAFSVASGKTSMQFSKSEESDPDKTWQTLRNLGMLHDAIPYPNDRVNHSTHVKVARRHFSTATWGRPTSNSLRTKAVGALKTNSVLGSRLHACNYELGIVFIVPPSDANSSPNHKSTSLDDIILTFVVPAPKYRPNDTPTTKQAMREALVECEREISMEAVASG
ncbi:unnamed protein product [Camellia sinensis]